MATTTNYAWETPDDTDLVKDGAAAIRTLGSSIDTTTKALNPGTTAGDLDYYTSSTAKSRIGIGTSGQVLTVTAGVPAWGAPPSSSAAVAQIASGTTTSGTSLSLTSLTAYDTLKLRFMNVTTSANNSFTMRINSSSSSVYDYLTWFPTSNNTSAYDGTQFQLREQDSSNTSYSLTLPGYDKQNNSSDNIFQIDFYNCKATGFTTFEYQGWYVLSNGAGYRQFSVGRGIFKTAAAVSSIQFNTTSAFTAGSYVLWGG